MTVQRVEGWLAPSRGVRAVLAVTALLIAGTARGAASVVDRALLRRRPQMS